MAERIPKLVADLYAETSTTEKVPTYQDGAFKQMVAVTDLGTVIGIGDTYPANPTLNQLFINTTLTA